MHRSLLLLPLLLTACAVDDTATCDPAACEVINGLDAAPLEAHHSACSDTWVNAWSDDDTYGLHVVIPELVANAAGTDATLSGTPSELGATVSLQWGTSLSTAYCSDDINAVVETEHHAVGGELTIELHFSEVPGEDPTVTLGLSSVLFEDEAGVPYRLDDLVIPSQRIISSWGG